MSYLDCHTKVKLFLGIIGSILIGVGVLFVAYSYWKDTSNWLSDEEIRSALHDNFIADVEIGQMLFHMGGCADCHTVTDTDDPNYLTLAGGNSLVSSIGTFYPPNITPDKSTGIGTWSQSDFINAMVNGVGPKGQHYYPAFPYTAYAKTKIEDLLHLKAYLDSVEPVNRIDQSHELNFPFNFRFGNLFWKALFHDNKPYVWDSLQSDLWNRGAYIVNGLAHCGTCHTPRNILFAEQLSKRFIGASPLKDGERDAPGIAGLDENKILNALDEWSGAVRENSSMYLVTIAFSQNLPIEDSQAVATYLSSINNIQTAVK